MTHNTGAITGTLTYDTFGVETARTGDAVVGLAALDAVQKLRAIKYQMPPLDAGKNFKPPEAKKI